MKSPKTLSILPGCTYHEHKDWIIGPVGHHRDSDLVETSNWDVMIERYREIDPDECDHEIHRFNHWGVGWIEEIAVRPNSPCAGVQAQLRATLETSVFLDEDHHTNLEHETAEEYWRSYQDRDVRREVCEALQRTCTEACLNSPHEHCICDTDERADAIEKQIDAIGVETFWDIAVRNGGNGVEIDEQGTYRFDEREIERIASALVERGLVKIN